MLSAITSLLTRIKQVAGVEVSLLPESKMAIHMVVLTKKKNIISIEKVGEHVEGLEKLKELLPKDIPVALAVTGRGVLSKKIEGAEVDIIHSMNAILPNARVSDFYIQKLQESSTSFVSIIRQDVLDGLLQQFMSRQLAVINVSLGPFPAANLSPFVKSTTGNLSFAGNLLLFDSGGLKDFRYTETDQKNREIEIGDESIRENLLLPYSVAFQAIAVHPGAIVASVPQVVVEKEEFKHKSIFKVFGWALLIFFLVILLINFITFDYYNRKNQSLSTRALHYTGLVSKLDTLQKKVSEKEAFLTNAGWLEHSKASLFADRIAASVPVSIKLSELKVSPLNEKESRIEKRLIFESGSLRVVGHCRKSTDLNPWIKELKGMDWVKSVKIQDYTFDNKERTGVFILNIKVK